MIRVGLVGEVDDGRFTLRASLTKAGMNVRWLPLGNDVDAVLSLWPAEVAIIDAGASSERGLLLATRLRLATNIGIVLIVGNGRRGERLRALSLGADHCFIKPIDPREIELSILNLHRRLEQGAQAQPVMSPRRAASPECDVWIFDTSQWKLIAPAGEPVDLSLAEYHLLRQLFSSPGEIVSRSALMLGLDRGNVPMSSRNLDMIVSRLRRKVRLAQAERLPVLSARGVGYVFTGRCLLRGREADFAANRR